MVLLPHRSEPGRPGSLLADGYNGLWRVDLKEQGCEAIERETLKITAP
jgi:hypothetical protein